MAGALVLACALLRQTLLHVLQQLLEDAQCSVRQLPCFMDEAARANVGVSDCEHDDDDHDNQQEPAYHRTLLCGFPPQQDSPSVKRWGAVAGAGFTTVCLT